MDIQKFFEALDEKGFRTYAITGGGGKTSLMFALGRYFAKRLKTLVTTTTKIRRPGPEDCALTVGTIVALAKSAANLRAPCLCAAGAGYEGEKLTGFAPEEIDVLAERRVFDRIIAEADGSRGLSLKAYEEWEPPVPKSADCHIVVVGADILKSPLSQANVFRFEKLRERFGVRQGERISTRVLAEILSSKSEYLKNSPRSAYRVLLLNKCELFSAAELSNIAAELKELLPDYNLLAPVSLWQRKLFCA